MAESLLELKRKISSIKKTGQITEAMRMVSGVKLMKTEKLDDEYTDYHNEIRSTVAHLMRSKIFATASNLGEKPAEVFGAPSFDYQNFFDLGRLIALIKPRKEIKTTGYLVITGDHGLVGSYNNQIIKNMMSIFQDSQSQKRDFNILAVGNVGAQFFKKRKLNVVYQYSGLSDVPVYKEVRDIVQTAVRMYLDGVYDELYVCYSHHVNTLTSAFRVEKMLPLSDIDLGEGDQGGNEDFLIAPDIDSLLRVILPLYAKSMIFGAIIDAKTAELASSMTAMQSASQNADDIVSDLKTRLNRARQAQITTEITEIVGGANALK